MSVRRGELGAVAVKGAGARGGVGFAFSSFRLDSTDERLWKEGEALVLRPKTFAVLRYLVEHAGRLVTKQELLDALWGDVCVAETVLRTHVKALRAALGDDAQQAQLVETVHGRGYRFIATVVSTSEKTPASTVRVRGQPMGGASPTEPMHFVGRAAELRALDVAFKLAVAGHRRLVLISGEAGIGKTSLVNEYLLRIRERTKLSVARGQCFAGHGHGEAYLPIFEAISRLVQNDSGGDRLRVLARYAPTWLAQMPELTESDRGCGSRIQFAGATPERMLREMAGAFPLLGSGLPVVLVLEDLQWADVSTLALLQYLVLRSEPARLLILGTYRSTENENVLVRLKPFKQSFANRVHIDEISLDCLEEPDVCDYLKARFEKHEFPPKLARALLVNTLGNPLFLLRVVDSLVKRKLVHQEQSGWLLSGSVEEVTRDIPESVLAAIEDELERLPEFECQVLQVASVVGIEFSSATVAAALEEDPVRVEQLCARWARQRRFLVKKAGRQRRCAVPSLFCGFTHALYQQALYAQLGPVRRSRLHLAIGRHEEKSCSRCVREIAAELALHFECGGDAQQAIGYLQLAGEQAVSLGAHREATTQFERALLLIGRLPNTAKRGRLELKLCIALGAPLAMTVGYASKKVKEVYLRAMELRNQFGQAEPSAEVLAGLGAFYLVRGEYELAEKLAEPSVGVEPKRRDLSLEFEARYLRGMVLSYRGRPQSALEELQQAILLQGRAREPTAASAYTTSPEVASRAAMTLPLWLRGNADEALAVAENAAQLAEKLGDPGSLVFAQYHVVCSHLLRGEAQKLIERADRLIQLCESEGFVLWRALTLSARGGALIQRGDFVEGLEQLQSSCSIIAATGAQIGLTLRSAYLAEAYMLTGFFEQSEQELRKGLAFATSQQEGLWTPELHRLQGELILRVAAQAEVEPAAGRSDPISTAVEAHFSQSLKLAHQSGLKSLELRAATSLARFWAKRGRVGEGNKLLVAVHSRFKEGEGTRDLQVARDLLLQLNGNIE